MADIKYQVFVSSTYADLIDERQALSRAILDMGHIPAGMEMFPAADVEQLSYIKKVIDECDYYVLILGARYGSLDPKGVSFTEREYDYAVETGKAVLAFIHNSMDDIPFGKTDKDQGKFAKLVAFKDKVTTGRLVKFWANPNELAANAVLALNKAFSSMPQIGWIRADKLPSQSTMADILNYKDEIDKLKTENKLLKGMSLPKFEDAADFSEAIIITFTYSANSSTQNTASRTMNYYNFLRIVAPALHTPATITMAVDSVASGLKERFSAPGYSIKPKKAEVQDALLHLVATGHVHMWAGAAQGGQGHVTGYQLTPLGTKVWQEMSYVKKSSEEGQA